MAVRRLAVERRCHSSCGLLQGRRLPAVKGSVPALGAILSDSEDVAVALVGRTGEEKGGESRWTKLSITSWSSHKYQRHTLCTLAHPQTVKTVTDYILQYSQQTHTQINSTPWHTQNLKALSSDRNTETIIILAAPIHTSNILTNKSTLHYPPASFKFRFKSKVIFKKKTVCILVYVY